jgi:putative intracellular protease/amidase
LPNQQYIKKSSVKILIITTSHEQLGNTGRKTGVWLEELAVPYYIFKDAGAEITLASPAGGDIPVDPKSESIIASTSTLRRFQKDLEVISWVAHSIPLHTLKATDFDMVLLPGGHGAMWDFHDNEPLMQLLEDFSLQGKIIGLLSHGVSALVSMKSSDGEPFVKGKDLTSYSDTEEERSGLTGVVPFSLQSKLTASRAYYSKADNYICHSVTSGHVVTGQNPASSAAVAKKMLALMKDIAIRRPAPQPY